MGFLNTYNRLNESGFIFTIATPYDSGIIYTNKLFLPSEPQLVSNSILSNYTIVSKTGISNIYAVVKKNGIETEYSINTGISATDQNILIRYDPSDDNPSFIYYEDSGIYKNLRYMKLINGIWSGLQIGNIGSTPKKETIDFEYDPNDNLPACISYSSLDYSLNYFKLSGSLFNKTKIHNGNVSDNATSASLKFDSSDGYPAVSYIKSADRTKINYSKYNGTSWTTINTGTFDTSYSKRDVNLIFNRLNEPVTMFCGNTTGLFLNAADENGVWKSGQSFSNKENIYQTPQIQYDRSAAGGDSSAPFRPWTVYLNNQNGMTFQKVTYYNFFNFTSSFDIDQKSAGNPNTINKFVIVSGLNSIDINQKYSFQIDSDSQPVVFYKSGDLLMYIKNTGKSLDGDPIVNQSTFTGKTNFKNLPNSNTYRSYGIELFKDDLQVYQIGEIKAVSLAATYFEYKSPYRDSYYNNFSNTMNGDPQFRKCKIKINPLTNQPNIVISHDSLIDGSNRQTFILFRTPNNNQRTLWNNFISFSGQPYLISSTLPNGYSFPGSGRLYSEFDFDIDKDTNKFVVAAIVNRTGTNARSALHFLRFDPITSGYENYQSPWTGSFSNTNLSFKINPLTKNYCCAISTNTTPTTKTGLMYYEMNPNTLTWTESKAADEKVASAAIDSIHLDFKSNGNPIILYSIFSGTTESALNSIHSLKIAEYDGSNWTRTTIKTGDRYSFYYNDFKYNTGENYYAVTYRGAFYTNPTNAYFITNKNGYVQEYDLGEQHSNTKRPFLFFKRNEDEIRPFVYVRPSGANQSLSLLRGGPYGYFHYLKNGQFITGKFINDLDFDGDIAAKGEV